LLLGATGCASWREKSRPKSDGGKSAAEPVAVAPRGLILKVWIRSPDVAWQRVQHGAGGALGLLPGTAAGLAFGFARVDAEVARWVDGRATGYAVVAEHSGGEGVDDREGGEPQIGWAVALPLRDERRAVGALLDGDLPRYTSRMESGIRVFARTDVPLSIAVGIARGWLLMASDDQDLVRLGDYAYRAMPEESAPSSSASMVAVASRPSIAASLASRLSARWRDAREWLIARDRADRARHRGRAPDFADPIPILDAVDSIVQRRIAFVADAQAARLEVDAGEDEVHAELFIAPGRDDTEDGSARFAGPTNAGDARPLADVAADAAIAVMVRDGAEARWQNARELSAAIVHALGPRLREADARSLASAFEDWSRGRGDWMTAALRLAGGAPGLWLRTPAADRDAVSRGLRELFELSHRRALAEPLSTLLHLAPVTLGSVEMSGGGTAALATFATTAGPPAKSAPLLGISWMVSNGDLLLAAGRSAPELLATQASAARLGDDVPVTRALAALGDGVNCAWLAQPLRLDGARSGPAESAPMVLAWGMRGTDVWIRFELADPLLREALRLSAGL
jgi:hypothetical protein